MKLILRLLINIVAIWVAVYFLEPITVEGNSLWGWLLIAIVFGLVNTFIRPIVKLLTLPINVLTLGLFTLVINTLMLIITSWITPLNITGNFFQVLLYAFLGSLIISIVSVILSWILPDD